MAYIVNVTETATAIAATYAVSLGAHTTNDYLMVCLSQDGGGTTISLGSDSVTVSSDSGAKFTYATGANDYWDDGEQIILTGTMPGGFTSGTRYYIRELNTTTNTFYLETSVGAGRIAYSSAGASVIAHRMTGGASANNNCVGWKMIGTQAAFADCRQVWAYKIATSAAESNPTFTGTNDDWSGTCHVVRDADTAGTILWQRSDWGGSGAGISSGTSNSVAASSAGGTTVITAPEDALLLYSWVMDGGTTSLMRCESDELICDSKTSPGGTAQIVGHRQHGASGNPADVTMYSNAVIEGGNGWVLSIPNATGENLEKDCRSGITEVEWFGNFFLNRGALVTISNASPAVVTYTAPTTDQWLDGQAVTFSTTGSLPTGLTANVVYYITGLNTGTNTFNVSATLGGATINTSSAGSGTHTATPSLGAANDLISTINSISTLSTVPTIAAGGFSAPATPWGTMTQITLGTSTSGAWAGGTRKIPPTDMSGGIVALQWMVDMAPTTAVAGAEGAIIAFSDGTNWSAYQLAPRSLYAHSTVQQAFIDLDNGTKYASSGTLNTAAVTHVIPLYHRVGSVTTTAGIYVKNLFVMRTAVLTGGGEDRPVDFVTLYDVLNSWGSIDLASKQGSSQILGKADVQIGDGTNKMYFDSSGAHFEFPIAFSTSNATAKNWNGLTGSLNLNIKAAAGNTVNLAAGGITTSVPQSVTIDATSSASATYSVAGQSLKGLSSFTDNAGIVLSGPTFKECGTVTLKNSMTGMSVSKTVGAVPAAAMTANSKTLTSCTIDLTGTTATYHLSLSSSVTAITLNTVTLSGTPATDKIYSELASGTLTITTNGLGTALVAGDVTFIGGSTATAVIASPQVYQKVTVTGITTGARVQIYDTTSSTELFNGTATAGNTVVTGGTVVWTDPVAASANRAIRIRVSYVSGVTAKNFIETSGLTCGQTSGTAEITYPVSPTDDTVYNANGENGSTIYGGGEITFVDASPDRVEMNMTASTLSLQKQYAAWAYYAFTATGIATDIDYINAIDTANYEFTSIRWKNTATAPATLTITGGYAWDSSTGLAITLVDTSGGTIFLMPDHVVAYATGSGVTAQDVADIAAASATSTTTAVLTAAQTTPIHADIRKVNNHTVDGVGSDADPWGPA